MKKIKYAVKFVCGFAILLSIFFILTFIIPDQFENSYQRVLINQYDYYQSIEENKILFIGGSSLSFGLDLDFMEELTGETCVILGNNGGYGLDFLINLSKSNLISGDIVVIEFNSDTAEAFGADLILSAIGNRIELYKYISFKNWDNALMEYGTYTEKKIYYYLKGGYNPTGIYSAEAFDYRGNMIAYRGECIGGVGFDYISEFPIEYNEESIEILNDYIAYCESIGVDVYFTVSPHVEESVSATEEEIMLSDSILQELLDAPLISDSLDYCMSSDYFYDTYRHCNTAGAEKRTQLLYEDMCDYGIFD